MEIIKLLEMRKVCTFYIYVRLRVHTDFLDYFNHTVPKITPMIKVSKQQKHLKHHTAFTAVELGSFKPRVIHLN